MTELQAQEFIKLLESYYPNYEMPNDEFAEWCSKLKYYDFTKAKLALSQFMFERTQVTSTPPNGKIIAILKSRASIPNTVRTFNTYPVLAYEICKIGQDRGMTFRLHNLPVSPEEVEAIAIRDLQKCKRKYGCDMYLIRHWEEHYNQVNEQDQEMLYGQDAFDLFVANTLNLPEGHKRKIWLIKYLNDTKFSKDKNFVPEMNTVPAAKNINNERNEQKQLLGVR